MKIAKTLIAAAVAVSAAHCAQAVETSFTDVAVAPNFYVPYEGKNPLFKDGFVTGFGSALAYYGKDSDGSLLFYGLTDRGPNDDGPFVHGKDGKAQSAKYFPSPKFAPEIGIIKYKDGKAEIVKTITLKNADGTPITGLPIPQGTGSTGEAALDDENRLMGYDVNGQDPEGLAFDKNGDMWISDEYGPFLTRFDKDGVLQEKLAPGQGIPEIFKHRTPNRGAEGVTILPDGTLALMEQSVLNLKHGDQKSGKTASFCRLALIDPVTRKVKTVGYPINTDYKKPGDAKLGDILAVNNHEVLIIEQGKDKDKKMQNRIYRVDFSKADDLTDAQKDGLEPEFFKDAGGFRLAKKTLLVDLRKLGWDIEKAEGLTMLPDRNTLVVTNDNDFGLELDVSDPEREKAKPGDYTLEDDGSYTVDGKKANPKFDFGRNAPEEQVQKLMFIKLDSRL